MMVTAHVFRYVGVFWLVMVIAYGFALYEPIWVARTLIMSGFIASIIGALVSHRETWGRYIKYREQDRWSNWRHWSRGLKIMASGIATKALGWVLFSWI